MTTKERKRGPDGRFLSSGGRKKNDPAPAPAKRTAVQRRRNPAASAPATTAEPAKRRRRKHNPAGAAFSKAHVFGYGTSLLVGGMLGALSGGADKVLDPKLTGHGLKRGLIDLAGGAGVGLIGAFAGMPTVANAAIAAGGALAGLRMVNHVGDAQDNIDRLTAAIALQQERLTTAATVPPQTSAGPVQRRMLLPGSPRMLPQAAAPWHVPAERQGQQSRVRLP